jgi:hypothetical protein
MVLVQVEKHAQAMEFTMALVRQELPLCYPKIK